MLNRDAMPTIAPISPSGRPTEWSATGIVAIQAWNPACPKASAIASRITGRAERAAGGEAAPAKVNAQGTGADGAWEERPDLSVGQREGSLAIDAQLLDRGIGGLAGDLAAASQLGHHRSGDVLRVDS